jgi:hypothetical protein
MKVAKYPPEGNSADARSVPVPPSQKNFFNGEPDALGFFAFYAFGGKLIHK